MGENKGKQLDLSKRKVIAKALEDDKTATEIASLLSFHKSTISREVRKYRYISFKGDDNPSICSTCSRNASCSLKHKCGRMVCGSKCVGCKSLETCDKYVEIKCHNYGFEGIVNGDDSDHYDPMILFVKTASLSILVKETIILILQKKLKKRHLI